VWVTQIAWNLVMDLQAAASSTVGNMSGMTARDLAEADLAGARFALFMSNP
jgi:hypothetical protein